MKTILPLFAVISLIPLVASGQQKLSEEEKAFIRDKQAKQIYELGGMRQHNAAREAAHQLAQTADGRKILVKAILSFGKKRREDMDDAELSRRWKILTDNYVNIGTISGSSPGFSPLTKAEVPEEMIQELVSCFRVNCSDVDSNVRVNIRFMEFVAEFGPKAAKAIPILEKIRDDNKQDCGVIAMRAIAKIKGK